MYIGVVRKNGISFRNKNITVISWNSIEPGRQANILGSCKKETDQNIRKKTLHKMYNDVLPFNRFELTNQLSIDLDDGYLKRIELLARNRVDSTP